MPKRKSNRSARKRFKVTGKGRVKRTRANKSHRMYSFSNKRVRQLRGAALVSKGEEDCVLKMLLAD